MRAYWPHQERAHEMSRTLYKSNCKAWCVVSPCGSGKSTMMQRIAIPAASNGLRTFVYTHRVMLTRQIVRGFQEAGVEVGAIAASLPKLANPDAMIQICSQQTVHARLQSEGLPKADLVIVDEAHAQTGAAMQELFARHKGEGAKIMGYTATPVGLGGMYDQLVEAGKYSEMIACKAHLPILCYGPDRPDLSQLKPMAGGDFSSESDRLVNRVPTIIGRVYEYWQKLNPLGLPAIGFAPGVAESRWFVEEFRLRGVPCAHIDAERVLMVDRDASGNLVTNEYPTDDESRQAVLDGSKEGRYKIVWNRFVLREAIDMPWLYHAIAATSMGSVATYLQSIGRVCRYYSEYDHVILQDHGGNIDRHGTPDIDRNWELGCTANSVHKDEVEQRAKSKEEDAEPICCPKCCAYRVAGPQCPSCGYIHSRSSRMVRQLDGTLVRKSGRVVKHKPAKQFDDIFRSSLFAAGVIGQSVQQAYYVAVARAKKDNVEVVSSVLKPPAIGSDDWGRSVREVYPWAGKRKAKQ